MTIAIRPFIPDAPKAAERFFQQQEAYRLMLSGMNLDRRTKAQLAESLDAEVAWQTALRKRSEHTPALAVAKNELVARFSQENPTFKRISDELGRVIQACQFRLTPEQINGLSDADYERLVLARNQKNAFMGPLFQIASPFMTQKPILLTLDKGGDGLPSPRGRPVGSPRFLSERFRHGPLGKLESHSRRTIVR